MLVLLLIDPTRTLWPVFVLLGLAVPFFVLPRSLQSAAPPLATP